MYDPRSFEGARPFSCDKPQVVESALTTPLPMPLGQTPCGPIDPYSASNENAQLILELVVPADAKKYLAHRSYRRALLSRSLYPIGLISDCVPFTPEAGPYALPMLPCHMDLSTILLARTSYSMVTLRSQKNLSMRF
jgi:hypothetical protein